MKVVKMQRRQHAHIRSDVTTQVAEVVRETKTMIVVKVQSRPDVRAREERYSKRTGRPVGLHILVHTWTIVGPLFEGEVIPPTGVYVPREEVE